MVQEHVVTRLRLILQVVSGAAFLVALPLLAGCAEKPKPPQDSRAAALRSIGGTGGGGAASGPRDGKLHGSMSVGTGFGRGGGMGLAPGMASGMTTPGRYATPGAYNGVYGTSLGAVNSSSALSTDDD